MTRPTGPARHAGGMNIYLINALLVLLVVRQIREHQLDLRALAVPVLAVGAAAVMFLHSVPGGGSDIALDLLCLSAGAALGAIGGLATHLRVGGDGLAAGPRRRPGGEHVNRRRGRPDGLLLRRDPRQARPLPGSASRTTSPAPAPGPPRWS